MNTEVAINPISAMSIIENSGENFLITEPQYFSDLVDMCQAWAIQRNITAAGGATALSQMKKLEEEVSELREGLEENNKTKVVDGVGDAMTVLIQICRLYGITLDECLAHAYNEIKDRKGKMINGVFVKEIV